MRPVLPFRDSLFAAVAESPSVPSEHRARWENVKKKKKDHVSGLVALAQSTTMRGDVAGVETIAQNALASPSPVNQDIAFRAVVLTALNTACKCDSEGTLVQQIVSRIAARGWLFSMDEPGLGQILDLLTGYMLSQDDINGAFRAEFLSRILEIPLSRKTYTHLIRTIGIQHNNSNLVLALGMFHRALTTGIKPNTAMFNAVLETCLVVNDGSRAVAVLAEMAREEVPINGCTLNILLRHARNLDNVDAIFALFKSQSQNKTMRVSAGMAFSFIDAYIRVSKYDRDRKSFVQEPADDIGLEQKADGMLYMERCFELVDWFYSQGLGVTTSALDKLIVALGNSQNAEGALRAWREMRRGWLGTPSRKGRRVLLSVVGNSELPDRVEHVLSSKLLTRVGPAEKRRLQRHRMRFDSFADDEIMQYVADENDKDLSKDQATIIYRWVEQNRLQDAIRWISGRVESSKFISLRVLLALLTNECCTESVLHELIAERKSRRITTLSSSLARPADTLRFVLHHLSNPRVLVEGGSQDKIVERVVNVVLNHLHDGGDAHRLQCQDSLVETFRRLVERRIADAHDVSI